MDHPMAATGVCACLCIFEDKLVRITLLTLNICLEYMFDRLHTAGRDVVKAKHK